MKVQFQNSTLTIFESALYQTTSTVIIHSDFILIVDPNWLPLEIETIQQFVKENRESQPLYLLFTHSDYDHIIAYRAFPGAKVIASLAFKNQPKKNEILQQILDFDDENYIHRNYPIEYPNVDIVISEDNEKVEIEGVSFIFQQAQGHNDDGIFTWIPSLGIFIVGDYLCDVEFPFIYVSGLEYLRTLGKAKKVILENEVQFFIAGHGNFTQDKSQMLQRVEEAKKYINDLISAINNNESFDFESFVKKYHFPKGMRSAHQKNLEIITKELQNK